jgi:hypothetical protein
MIHKFIHCALNLLRCSFRRSFSFIIQFKFRQLHSNYFPISRIRTRALPFTISTCLFHINTPTYKIHFPSSSSTILTVSLLLKRLICNLRTSLRTLQSGLLPPPPKILPHRLFLGSAVISSIRTRKTIIVIAYKLLFIFQNYFVSNLSFSFYTEWRTYIRLFMILCSS